MNIPALPALTIHHVSIAVPDLEAAIGWYGEIFGFEVEQRMDAASFGLRGAFLRRPGVRLELWQSLAPPATPDARRAPKMDLRITGTKHLAFVVPDLSAAMAALLQRGVEVLMVQRARTEPMRPDPEPLAPGKPRLFAAFIADPFGTAIELIDGAQVGEGV
jgi:methylmalonyl-CoA/ethylmalonyl-CoA epimerase